MRIWRSIVLCTVVFLTACSTLEPRTTIDTLQPAMPRPISRPITEWQVVTVDGLVYVALPYEKFIDYIAYQEDILRYMRQTLSVICYYRDDLKEEQCIDRSEN